MNATNHIAFIVRTFNADGTPVEEGTRVVAPIAPRPRRIRDSIVGTFPANWGDEQWSMSELHFFPPSGPFSPLAGERWDLDEIWFNLVQPWRVRSPDESGIFVRNTLPTSLVG